MYMHELIQILMSWVESLCAFHVCLHCGWALDKQNQQPARKTEQPTTRNGTVTATETRFESIYRRIDGISLA